MSDRWIALHCGEDTDSLVENHPNAFLLLAQIAMRAKWKDCPITKLKAGQAFIGDWKKAGIHSEMAYRHAKTVLETCELATFKGTNKGTVASLVTTGIFSVSAEARNRPRNMPTTDQGTDQQQAINGQGTSNHTDTQKDGYTDHTDTPPPNPQGGNAEKSDNLPTSPTSIRISELFHRRPSTRWSDKEIRAFKAIPREAMEHLEIVCRYTEEERQKGEQGRHRRDLATFLNNFTGELDRARATPINGKSKTTSAAQYGI